MRGHYHVAVTDILLQAPVNMTLYLDQGSTSGHDSLVPSVIRFRPQESGEIHIDASHVCSGNTGGTSTGSGGLDMGMGVSETASVYSNSSSNPTRYTNNTNNNSTNSMMPTNINTTTAAAASYSMVVIQTASPHIAIIIDAPVKQLVPGAELLTIAVGPRDGVGEGGYGDWDAFGVHLTGSGGSGGGGDDDWNLEDIEETYSYMSGKVDADRGLDPNPDPGPAPDSGVDITRVIPPGCPILIKTDKYIKFLTQMKKIHATVYFRHVFRFIAAHFDNIPKLQEYMNSCMYMCVYVCICMKGDAVCVYVLMCIVSTFVAIL